MSKLVTTADGLVFRHVRDGQKFFWMLDCPVCGEHLPLTEAMLQGEEPTFHTSLKHKSSYCEFGYEQRLGADLVAAMQVKLINSEPPTHEEEPF